MLSPETLELNQGPQGRKKQREGHDRTSLINIYHTSQPCSKVFAPSHCQAWFNIFSQLWEPPKHPPLLRMHRSCCLLGRAMKTFWGWPLEESLPSRCPCVLCTVSYDVPFSHHVADLNTRQSSPRMGALPMLSPVSGQYYTFKTICSMT